jgi:hypothetical protein
MASADGHARANRWSVVIKHRPGSNGEFNVEGIREPQRLAGAPTLRQAAQRDRAGPTGPV